MTKQKSRKRSRFSFLPTALLCLALAGCSPSPAAPDTVPGTANASQDEGDMAVHFIDVGQGDSTLIESSGHYLLIDGGNNDQEEVVTGYLKNQGVKRLDYVILTHPDADHVGGIDAVISSFPVDKLIMPPISHTTRTFEDVLDAAAQKNLKLTKPVVGTTYQLGNASFTVIAPNRDYGDDLNNWSVGIKITNGSNSFVLCGDAETDAEHDIANNGIDLTADVLKLGHHGSSTSSSDEFLDAVLPETAVISCGKDNTYGHPHRETLAKMNQRGIAVYRTDVSGTLVALSDGSRITWNVLGENEKEVSNSQPAGELDYVLNTGTKKFHLPSCSSVSQMKQSNRESFHCFRQNLIDQGYTPCQNCNP